MATNDGASSSPRDSFVSLLDSRLHDSSQAQDTDTTQRLSSQAFCDILTRTTTTFVRSQQKSEEASEVNILSLPTELRMMIFEVKLLSTADKFCLKLASTLFFQLGPSFERLKRSISPNQRYDLAMRLQRRLSDTYLCAGCKTRHSENLFEDKEKHMEDCSRLCIGHTGAMTLHEGLYVTWSCIEKARTSSSTFMNSEGDTFFACTKWMRDPTKARVVQIDGSDFLEADSGIQANHNKTNSIETWLEAKPMSTSDALLGFHARSVVTLHFSWLEFFLSVCNRLYWMGDSKMWFDHMSPWNTNLCEHMDLCCEEVFEATRATAQDFTAHDTREIGYDGELARCRSFYCFHCDAKVKVGFCEYKSGGLYLEFESWRHLGPLIEPAETRWIRHLSPRNVLRKKLGPKWKES